jgi:hypothetical protein
MSPGKQVRWREMGRERVGDGSRRQWTAHALRSASAHIADAAIASPLTVDDRGVANAIRDRIVDWARSRLV